MTLYEIWDKLNSENPDIVALMMSLVDEVQDLRREVKRMRDSQEYEADHKVYTATKHNPER